MSGKRRTYTSEFKQEAIGRWFDSGHSMAQVERELQIPLGSIGKWKRAALSDRQGQLGGLPATGSNLTQKEINDIRRQMRMPDKPTIWTNLPVDPDWVQYFGYTLFGQGHYKRTNHLHSGIDLGKYSNSFTGKPRQFPIRAGCKGKVVRVDVGEPYGPASVRLIPDADRNLTIIYGHLDVNDLVQRGARVDANTIIGYLETTEYHVHLELRLNGGSVFVHPWPYLSEDGQSRLARFADTSSGTKFLEGTWTPVSGSHG